MIFYYKAQIGLYIIVTFHFLCFDKASVADVDSETSVARGRPCRVRKTKNHGTRLRHMLFLSLHAITSCLCDQLRHLAFPEKKSIVRLSVFYPVALEIVESYLLYTKMLLFFFSILALLYFLFQ